MSTCTEFLGSILGTKSCFFAGVHFDDDGRKHLFTTGVAKIHQSIGVQRLICFCAYDPEILSSISMATSTLFSKQEVEKILNTSPWQEFNDADLGHSTEESIAITLFSSTYNLRLGIRRTSAVTEVWLHPVGYDVGRSGGRAP